MENEELRKYFRDSKGEHSVLVSDPISQIMYHGKIDWDVAKRLLAVIYSEEPVRPTRLAMRAGMNYDACKRYIIWMMEIDWVQADGISSNIISLTEFGFHTCACLHIVE